MVSVFRLDCEPDPCPSDFAPPSATRRTDGKTPDPANHQYGLKDFYAAVTAGNSPSVSYIKLPGLPGRPCRLFRPLDEQAGTVD